MGNGIPTLSGEIPSGTTMRPRYMGRTMNTYPVSEPEMENISSLSAQVTIRFSLASLLFGLACSIWINAMFYETLTAEAKLASKFVAPGLLFFSVLFVIGGVISLFQRKSAWTKIKSESIPVQAVAPAPELIISKPAA
jgi:hypothetical protein